MKPEPDEKVFDWILHGRDSMPKRGTANWRGNFVSQLVPPVFEAYAKILHRIDAKYEGLDNPLSSSEIELLKIPSCEPLKSVIEKRRNDPVGSRIRWKELAELLNIEFAPEICHEWYRTKLEDPWCWPHLLEGPADGWLSEDECKGLTAALDRFTAATEPCFFRFSDIPFITTPTLPQLFRGTVHEVNAFLRSRERTHFGFEYWWPRSRNWCVCSDYDLMFTFVGGSSELVSALLKNDVLECLEVTPRTRIDSLVPIP
jgi:hypothetical protein